MYTRITSYRKDNQELANGFIILNEDGAPLEGIPERVLLSKMENDLRNNLRMYGHSITRGEARVMITPSPTQIVWVPQRSGAGVANFEAATLGQFLRSHEDTTTGVPKCKGLVRPVFEMKASQQQQGQSAGYALMPGAAQGRSALWLFTTKKIEVPGKGFVCLG